MKRLLPLLTWAAILWPAPDADGIVSRSVAVNNADFEALPRYSHRETDFNRKSSKTYEVFMLDGSPYQKLIAQNGAPLPAGKQREEEEKLAKETERRRSESAGERADRIAKYKRDRDEEHLLMNEMVHAFQFKLAGEARINGRPVYVLTATPRPGYEPPNEKARVLTGMKGKLWIDKKQYHWVKVQAKVTRPVRFGLFVAQVRPGTRFEMDQSPVDANVWLPSHFSESVNARILGLARYRTQEQETYTDYRR